MAETIRNLQGNETKLMYEMINVMERVNASGDPPEMDGFVIPNYGYVTDRMGGIFVPPNGYSDIYGYKSKYFRYNYDKHVLEYLSISGSTKTVLKSKSMTLNEWLKDPLQNIKDYIKEIDSSVSQSSVSPVATFSMSRSKSNVSENIIDERSMILNSVAHIWKTYLSEDVTEDSLIQYDKLYKDSTIELVVNNNNVDVDYASDLYQKYFSTITVDELSKLI